MLAARMLARSGPLPTSGRWAFRPKWDGFRALVSALDGFGFRVRSRRGWDMTPFLPELASLPPGLVLDGELVALRRGRPHFPDVCRRLVQRDATVPLPRLAGATAVRVAAGPPRVELFGAWSASVACGPAGER